MEGNYSDAWQFTKGLIDARSPYPQHQGIVDITEFIDFATVADEHSLTQSQCDTLIDAAQKYYDSKEEI